jgi:hypothetical protein
MRENQGARKCGTRGNDRYEGPKWDGWDDWDERYYTERLEMIRERKG